MRHIGRKVTLKVDCLRNRKGTVGYVFNEYDDFDYPEKKGIQVIFPNGNYDGFGVIEQESFLEMGDIIPEYADYVFISVMYMDMDFRRGYWKWEND